MSDQDQADQGAGEAPSAEQAKSGPNCYVSRSATEADRAFQEALTKAFPFGCTARQLAAYFGNKAAMETVRGWRLGRRRPPQWALDLLARHGEELAACARQAKAGNNEAAGARALDLYRKKRRALGA